MPTKDATPHLRVRIEPRLLARLEKSRAKSGRTLTGEIEHRIEMSFQREDTAELITRAAKEAAELSATIVRGGSPAYKPEGEDSK